MFQLRSLIAVAALAVALSAQGVGLGGGRATRGEAGPQNPVPSEVGPKKADPKKANPNSAGQPKPGVSAEEAKAAALNKRIDKAISAYEKVRKSKTKLAQRRRLLGWLGELDHARVTEYLLEDLQGHLRYASGVYAIDALGKVSRPDVQDALVRVATGRRTHYSVRVAAARAVIAFGKRACEDLLDVAMAEERAGVRRGLLEGLATSGSEHALRGLASWILDGDHAHRLSMLMGTRLARGSAKIDRARVKCVREGNLAVAAYAWRLLVEQGHRRAKALTIDVLERVYDRPDARTAVDLVRGLVLIGDPDFYPAILRFGATRGRGVRAALRAVAPVAGKNADLIAFLIEEGLESEVAGERVAAKILLSEAPASAVAPLVARIRKQLKRNRKRVLASAAGLHELLVKDPTWVNDLAGMAAASDLDSRLLGLSMLLEMESPAAISSAQRYLKSRAWELRSVSIRYLTKSRDVTSIPLLIQRYGKEDGRLAHELATALFVHSGTRCWTRRDWVAWWRRNKEGFALPHPDSVKGGGSTSGGRTISYYDLPLVSSRIAFLVDHSGSMGAAMGTDRKRTRLDVAKEQLRMVVEALPKTHRVNLIPFETGVQRVWRDLKSLNSSNRQDLLKSIAKIRLAGGTNTYGALMLAFDDPEVDTIYLLTDGLPSAGELVDADEILEAVQRENRTRQIVVHCISVGRESTLLKDLAAMTGGQYKFVR